MSSSTFRDEKDFFRDEMKKPQFSCRYIGAPIENHEVHKNKTPFDIKIETGFLKKIVYNNESLITTKEIKLLSFKIHSVDTKMYNEQLNGLLNDYHEWLISHTTGTAIPESNRFHKIKDIATMVPSSNPLLIPLAFPNEVLRQQENRMEPDRSLMEATGVGFLVPSYQFRQEMGKESYTLRIEYRFVETENPNNQTIYADFIVAEVDQNTVKAFSKPIFTKDDELPSPNLNECLIQGMFCDFADSLGLPGSKSVSLGRGRWIAPAELPSGFFHLLERSPTSTIHFDSKEYTEALSQKAAEYATGRLEEYEELHRLLRKSLPNIHGIKIVVWKKIREAKEKLSQSKKALQDNYHTLWAYCRLLSSLDDDSLRLKLESDLGIIDPNSYDSLADLIAFGFEPTPVSVEDQMRFYTSLDTIPSTYLSQLQTTMQEINGKDIPADYSDLTPYVPNESSPTHVRRKYIPDINTTEIINSFNHQEPLKLRNIGNSCYISAVLQSLLCVEPLVEHLRLSLERKTNISDDKFTKASTIHQELLKFIGPASSPFPVGLRNAIFDYGHDDFSPPSKNQQKDAAVLMELLVDEFLPFRFSMAYHKTCDAFPGLEFIHHQEETTLQIAINGESPEITQLINQTFNAHKIENRTRFEPREAVPPQNSDPIYVDDYILEHRLSNLPPVMVVHLKRFKENEGKMVKINCPIRLPVDGIIDLSPFCETLNDDPQPHRVRYRIRSYVIHIGKKLHEGHYENYIEKGGNYFHCNDTNPNFFNEISQEDFLSRTDPYLIVMERINEEIYPVCSSSV